MPKFLINRNIPGAGGMSAKELMAASQKSCDVLRHLGPQIQWVHGRFVTYGKRALATYEDVKGCDAIRPLLKHGGKFAGRHGSKRPRRGEFGREKEGAV